MDGTYSLQGLFGKIAIVRKIRTSGKDNATEGSGMGKQPEPLSLWEQACLALGGLVGRHSAPGPQAGAEPGWPETSLFPSPRKQLRPGVHTWQPVNPRALCRFQRRTGGRGRRREEREERGKGCWESREGERWGWGTEGLSIQGGSGQDGVGWGGQGCRGESCRNKPILCTLRRAVRTARRGQP